MSSDRKTSETVVSFNDARPLETLFTRLGCGFGQNVSVENLPFANDDVSIGTESELQTSVQGNANDVDLPQTIRQSTFFSNLYKRASSGETNKKPINKIERYLARAPENTWENSWVRFPRRYLSPYAQKVLGRDLLLDKDDPASGSRKDSGKFVFLQEGEEWLRLPVSYLLKLSLADAVGDGQFSVSIRNRGVAMLDNFLNDNTSPETHSFYLAPSGQKVNAPQTAADESALRFFVSQLAVFYANEKLGLGANRQRAVVYNSPHPPVRQRELNDLVPDSFATRFLAEAI
ncbi:MAG: hypothetical protein HY280_05765 [Nitrospinae bacterium]|nr:hypothetical protein [Nitrospinota bacterium]